MNKIHLTLYTKSECSLCVPFKQVVAEVCAKKRWENRLVLQECDITQNPEAFEKYHEKIPVLEINGRLAFKYHILPLELEKYLARLL